MKKFLLAGIFALSFSGFAQDGAVTIFERAKAAHGATALETMTTYRDSGLINYYDEKGQVTARIEYRQLYNFTNSTVRFEYSQNKKLLQILQTTPSTAWGWTEQSGVVRLPPSQAKIVRDAISQGLFALRAKTADLKDLKLEGAIKLGNRDGTGISFTLAGAQNSFVVAADGTVIGGQTKVDANSTLLTVNSDFRTISGVKIAFVSSASLGGKIAYDSKTDSAEVNPALMEADFAQPK